MREFFYSWLQDKKGHVDEQSFANFTTLEAAVPLDIFPEEQPSAARSLVTSIGKDAIRKLVQLAGGDEVDRILDSSFLEFFKTTKRK